MTGPQWSDPTQSHQTQWSDQAGYDSAAAATPGRYPTAAPSTGPRPTDIVRTPGQTAMLPGTVSGGGLVYTSGLVSPRALAAMSTGEQVPAQDQIDDAVALLVDTLSAAGVGLDRVLKVEAFLSSAEWVPVWNDHFTRLWPVPGPARTTLVVGFTSPAIHFEVQAVAAR